ncbi:MAG: hypothetical protein AXW11_16370 [Marinobacter sp. Hex_13]|nr:MAG: hypothetical protein AXW11_16370 [Marinobacter sp. Hex_13]
MMTLILMIMAMLVLVLVLVLVTMMLVFVIMLMFVMMVFMIMIGRRLTRFACYQIHATFGATARLVFDNFRVHRADVLDFDVQDGGIKILR